MIEAAIIRSARNPNATPGLFRLGDQVIAATLELPWTDNKRSISCIPDGAYTCNRTGPRQTLGGLKIPTTFEVMNVPNRSGILFHVGNSVKDSNGCILIGSSYRVVNGEQWIVESRRGFEYWLKQFETINTFTLRITSVN